MRISYVQYYNVLQCKLYIASIIIYVIYIIIFSYLSYLPRWVPRVCPHLLLNIVAGSINLSFFFKNYNHHYKQNKLELLMSSDTRIMNSKILIKLFFFFLIQQLTMWSILEKLSIICVNYRQVFTSGFLKM